MNKIFFLFKSRFTTHLKLSHFRMEFNVESGTIFEIANHRV